MKDIPGYEIIEGSCWDCDIQHDIELCDSIETCRAFKCYKKKQEKSMTHDEINAVIQAHKERKEIQYMLDEDWVDEETNTPIRAILSCISRGYMYRIKPEPKVIPWTMHDCEEFRHVQIYEMGLNEDEPRIYQPIYWNDIDVYFVDISVPPPVQHRLIMTYKVLSNKKDINDKPCGKVAKE